MPTSDHDISLGQKSSPKLYTLLDGDGDDAGIYNGLSHNLIALGIPTTSILREKIGVRSWTII